MRFFGILKGLEKDGLKGIANSLSCGHDQSTGDGHDEW